MFYPKFELEFNSKNSLRLTEGFLTFPGCKEREHWPEMG